MARQTTSANGTNLSVAEMREKYAEFESNMDRYAKAESAINMLRNINKNQTKTISTFDKETLRSYLQNIGNSEVNLRNLSWYLYFRSQIYTRIINFYANMFCLDCRSVIPKYDLLKDNDPKKMLKTYQSTLDFLDILRLQQEFYNIYVTCFVQDVFYGVVFHDDTGIFIFPFPADYAKISGKYMTGDFSYAVDCSYFKKYPELLEWFPEPFKTLMDEYEKTNVKWQMMPDKYAMCLKWRSEDYQTVVPVFTPLFNSLINLSDLEDIQAIAAEQEIYKMLWIELETIQGSKDVDDWKVDPTLVAEYYDRMLSDLPEFITAAIIPGKLNEISFPNDTAKDTSKIAMATEAVLNTAGGAEILNGSTINNTYAFKMATIMNTEFAISSLLPQTQSWVNRYLSYFVTNPCKVKFFPISVYTKDDYRDKLLTASQNGLPNVLGLNTLNGFSEKETIALNFLEQDVLQLGDKLRPLQTSYTQSSNGYTSEVGQGAPTKDVITDETSDSLDNDRNNQ